MLVFLSLSLDPYWNFRLMRLPENEFGLLKKIWFTMSAKIYIMTADFQLSVGNMNGSYVY